MRRLFVLIPALILALGLIILSVANRETVLLDIPGSTLVLQLPLFAVFLAGIFLGALLAAILAFPKSVRASLAQRQSEKRARRAELALSELQAQKAEEQAAKKLVAIDNAQAPRHGSRPQTNP
ncbi:hypothetical protein GCM10007972_09140 [Iodidimonas muriae]|uniref:Lipopolysaccharide assembly protein A domain-containing protein n=1 Tax=Iodidimonas muriae TaxID=261467 RepID=A0ABQ2LAY9_9PROT|nr:lipopolysaccharide assembly protein LapA domain-containing protein [Iodidimonas muriae]GER06191.1 hypothetical protein JCM17843_05010 [Kordiimonadales bacterium JCM 17843]GGO08600.1 hypothetical protein GCM10007972_09140 [Iodidimonas muriae]